MVSATPMTAAVAYLVSLLAFSVPHDAELQAAKPPISKSQEPENIFFPEGGQFGVEIPEGFRPHEPSRSLFALTGRSSITIDTLGTPDEWQNLGRSIETGQLDQAHLMENPTTERFELGGMQAWRTYGTADMRAFTMSRCIIYVLGEHRIGRLAIDDRDSRDDAALCDRIGIPVERPPLSLEAQLATLDFVFDVPEGWRVDSVSSTGSVILTLDEPDADGRSLPIISVGYQLLPELVRPQPPSDDWYESYFTEAFQWRASVADIENVQMEVVNNQLGRVQQHVGTGNTPWHGTPEPTQVIVIQWGAVNGASVLRAFAIVPISAPLERRGQLGEFLNSLEFRDP